MAVVGEIAWRGPFMLHDFRLAGAVAQKPLKPVLPGPVTFARLCIDEHYGDHAGVARALAGGVR